MEIFKYKHDYCNPQFVEEHLEDLLSRVVKINDPNLVLTSLSLFDDEYFNHIEVIFIDNADLRTYLLLLNQKEDHHYLGFNNRQRLISNGALHSHNTIGFNMTMLSFRYIIILRSIDYMKYGIWYYGEHILHYVTGLN